MASTFSFPPDAKARVEMLTRLISKYDVQTRTDRHGLAPREDGRDGKPSLPGGEIHGMAGSGG